jgi:YD repeat-containing protein
MSAATPPTLTHYQRLQGYARVVQNLVWNPESGDIEMEAQAKAHVPRSSTEGSYVLAYDGSGNLSTVTMTIGGTAWVKTLSYIGGDLTGVSKWIEQ